MNAFFFFSEGEKGEINRYDGATRKKTSVLESTMALFIDGSEEKTSRWVRCVACLDPALAIIEAALGPTCYILPRLSGAFCFKLFVILVPLLFVPLPKDGWFRFQNIIVFF